MLTCYPVINKAKARVICEAFALGCGGTVAKDSTTLRDGDAAFYGVNASIGHVWRAMLKDSTRNWYYIDNPYFDATRGECFRITKNALQHSGLGVSDCKRFNALNIKIADWHAADAGKHIVVCEQSADYMQVVAQYPGDWLDQTLRALRTATSRELRVRKWQRDKTIAANTLPVDLMGAHALVTWNSAAAITAILAGVPAIVHTPCAASPMAGTPLDDIERLPQPEGRYNWCGVLADNQFTLDEMRSGYAWEVLNGGTRG